MELQYTQLKPTMYRVRRTNTPPIPQTLAEVHNLLSDPAYERFSKSVSNDDFYKCTVNDPEGGVSLVFASQKFLLQLHQANELHIDGTFKVRPNVPPSRQILTVMAMHYNHAFPVFFAVMERKNMAAYQSVLTKIKELAPGMNPNVIVTDFETGLQEATHRIFPNATVVGCWFHSATAMTRRARRLGLTNLINENVVAKRVVRMTMALPLLPSDAIATTFEDIKTYAEQNNLAPQLQNYLNYVQDTWIRGVGAAYLSVFGQQRRTNNDQESYHKQLSLIIKQVHPNFWVFIDSMKKVEHSYRQRFAALENGRPGPAYRRPAYLAQDARIANATSMLTNGLYTAWEFLSVVSHSVPQADLIDNGVVEEDADDVGPPPAGLPMQVELLYAPPPPAPVRGRGRGRGRLARAGHRGGRQLLLVNAGGIVGLGAGNQPLAAANQVRGRGQRGRGRIGVRHRGRGRGRGGVNGAVAPLMNLPMEILEEELVDQPEEVQQNESECAACRVAPATHIVIPCAHQCLCEYCTGQLRAVAANNPHGLRCPICRQNAQNILFVFLNRPNPL